MTAVHRLTGPAYAPEHVRTMVICCSDGRFVAATQDFLRARGLLNYDLVAIPGGAAEFLYEHETMFGALSGAQAAGLLARLHRTTRILVLAHADCGYYHHRLGVCTESQQKDDLRRAAEWLKGHVPAARVELYYVRPAGEQEGTGFTVESL